MSPIQPIRHTHQVQQPGAVTVGTYNMHNLYDTVDDPETNDPISAPADYARALSKLRWRCRRGLLENDLLIERFFARHAGALTASQARGLERLMDLADNDLLDLLLRRTELAPADDRADVREVLALLRPPPPALRIERAIESHPTHPEERA